MSRDFRQTAGRDRQTAGRDRQKMRGFVARFTKVFRYQDFKGYLRMDLYRVLVSPVFPLSVAGMAFMLYVSVKSQVGETGIDVAYVQMLSQTSPFNDIFYVLAALPFAAGFCLDWNHQFLKPLLIRGDAVPYTVSKISACALSGFAAIALGETLFVLFLRLRMPLADPNSFTFDIMTRFTHGALLEQGHPLLWFVFHIVGLSLGAAFYALLALLVSTQIQNVFVVMASPMILAVTFRTLSDTVFAWLPAWATPTVVLIGRSNLASPVGSFLYEVFVFLLTGVPLALLILRQVKRRLANG